MGKRHKMSLDSKLRRARLHGTGTSLHHYEVGTVCEALRLLRACERHEAAERAAEADAPAADQTEGLERFLGVARLERRCAHCGGDTGNSNPCASCNGFNDLGDDI